MVLSEFKPSLSLAQFVRVYRVVHFVFNNHAIIPFKPYPPRPEHCLSLRQYERKFVERMGVSPRYFSKVTRFENAFRMKNKEPHLDWLSIAIRCGYHDYQHLVKSYKEFTNQTPTHFHLLDTPERKFGETDTY